MTSLVSAALARRAKEQSDRVTATDLVREERDPWCPATLPALPRVSWKGQRCRACYEREAEKKGVCHRCYLRARRIAA